MSNSLWLGYNRILLKSNEYPISEKRCKRIQGAKFDRKQNCWTYPLDLKSCRSLREEFGNDLIVTKALAQWAREAIAIERNREMTIAGLNVTLPVLQHKFPEFYKRICDRNYQIIGARFIADNKKVILADDPGLGKTIQSIAAVVEAQIVGPVIVIAPSNSIRVVWEREIANLTGYKVWVCEGPRHRRDSVIEDFVNSYKDDMPYFLVCNTDMIRYKRWDKNKKIAINPPEITYPQLFDFDWSAIIVDEGQDALICTTRNFKKHTQVRIGMDHLSIRDGGIKLGMSGTPGQGQLYNIWGWLNWIDPRRYSGFWKWAEKHFYTEEGAYGGIILKDCKNPGAMYEEISDVMLRRTKSEVAPDLPDKIINNIVIPMTQAQSKAYKAIVKNGVAQVNGGTIMANGTLPETIRYRQIASAYGAMHDERFVACLPSNKFDWLCQFLEERGISKKSFGLDKVVVASEFSGLIRMFASEIRALGVKTAMLTGDTKGDDRVNIINDFQDPNSDLRLLFINKKAAGTAITLDRADDMVLLDRHWNPDVDKQVEDRIHRVSRAHICNYWYLSSTDTYEESVSIIANQKKNRLDGVIDIARGKELMLILAKYGQESFDEKLRLYL